SLHTTSHSLILRLLLIASHSPFLCPSSTCSASFFFSCHGDHRDLHSFPTRRSSDLDGHRQQDDGCVQAHSLGLQDWLQHIAQGRSEEHTSELQSRFDLVCRLLLEKKKKTLQPQ